MVAGSFNSWKKVLDCKWVFSVKKADGIAGGIKLGWFQKVSPKLME